MLLPFPLLHIVIEGIPESFSGPVVALWIAGCQVMQSNPEWSREHLFHFSLAVPGSIHPIVA